MFEGTVDSSLVHPRETFRTAILNNASSIVCFHNHPSGHSMESHEDVEVTKRIKGVWKHYWYTSFRSCHYWR